MQQQPMSKQPAQVKCDCTVTCGDDDRLKTGEVYPCDGLAIYEAIDRKNAIKAAGRQLQSICHGAAADAGWWQDLKNGQDHKLECRANTRFGKALVAEKLCLIHSEISEGMEGHRKNLQDDKLPHRSMLEVELADAAIRIFDLAGALGLDLGAAIAEKLAFNAQRPDHKPENRQAAGGKAY